MTRCDRCGKRRKVFWHPLGFDFCRECVEWINRAAETGERR